MSGSPQPGIGHLARLAGGGRLTPAAPRLPERFAPPDPAEPVEPEHASGRPAVAPPGDVPTPVLGPSTPRFAADQHRPVDATTPGPASEATRTGAPGPTRRGTPSPPTATEPATAGPRDSTAPSRLEPERPAVGAVATFEATPPDPRFPGTLPSPPASGLVPLPALHPHLPASPPPAERAAPPAGPAVLRVSIGRIDVRGPDLPPPRDPATPRSRAGLTLTDYLQGRRDE